MPRIPRSTFPPYGVFQITTRGVERRAVFLDQDDRLSFLAQLWRAVDDNGWIVYVVCLMTNHYHLVVEGRRERISRGMQRLNGLYAETFNAKYRRSGHLWGGPLRPLAGARRGTPGGDLPLRPAEPRPRRALRALRRLAVELEPPWAPLGLLTG
jgi:REP element-mobilizing transposase RayT